MVVFSQGGPPWVRREKKEKLRIGEFKPPALSWLLPAVKHKKKALTTCAARVKKLGEQGGGRKSWQCQEDQAFIGGPKG